MKKAAAKSESIFISIASYRDPELVPTILDCINKAHNKKLLHFGICLQDTTENLYYLKHIKRKYNLNLKIYFCDWRDSKGACWARHIIQKKLYNNQTYYLQLDSHHRFIDQWDSVLKHMYKNQQSLGFNKPILGGYCPGYNTYANTCDSKPIQIVCFDKFTEDGDLVFKPHGIDNYIKLLNSGLTVVPARFLSGHFIFTTGKFCDECLYDPNLYFRGEEISLSARAYTSGYDFFHPVIPIIWHFYLRPEQHKHWENHQTGNGFIISAENRSVKAKERVRKLLGAELNDINFAKYGLGKDRNLHEYELYAGLDFKNKTIHKYATNTRNDAPFAYKMSEEEWQKNMLLKKIVSVKFKPAEIELLKEDIAFIAVCIEDINNKLLHRFDIKKEDVPNIAKNNMEWRHQIGIENLPTHAILLPFHKEKGFGDRYKTQNIDYYDIES